MFTRILVPTDFSGPSDAALDYARVIARTFGASLHLLHVIEDVTDTRSTYDRLQNEAQAQFARRILPSDQARYGITAEVVAGLSADRIVSYARSQSIDLIVMGTHGRTGLAHLLMGSVAEHVVRTAHSPVLTVRYSAHQAATVSATGQTSRSGIALGLG